MVKTNETINSIYRDDSSKYNSVQDSLGPLNQAEKVKYVIYKQLANVAIKDPDLITYINIVTAITTIFIIEIVIFSAHPSN